MKKAIPLQVGKSRLKAGEVSIEIFRKARMMIRSTITVKITPTHPPKIKESIPFDSIFLAIFRRVSRLFLEIPSWKVEYMSSIWLRVFVIAFPSLRYLLFLTKGVCALFPAYFLCFFKIFLYPSKFISFIASRYATST